MIPDPLYWAWQKEIPESVCDAIIAEGKKLELSDGVVSPERKKNKDIRESQVGWFPNTKWVAGIMRHYMMLANYQAWKFNLSVLEAPQFTIYNTGGFYEFHQDSPVRHDYLKPDGIRKLSCTITISDPKDYEGGQFEFKDGTIPDIRERGSILVFPSFLDHRVTPVTSGTRYSLVAWHEGPKFI